MDIVIADKIKLEMRIARGYLLRKIKKEYNTTLDDIIYDLECSGNPVVTQIWNTVKKNADECIMDWQRKEVKIWSAIFLWILSKDTAYRDLFFVIGKELLDAKDKIYPELLKLAKDPEHWYPNAHQKSMDRRTEMKQKGELIEGGIPYDESIAVPSRQKKRILNVGRDVEPVILYKKR